jgi:CubicO group peptidase (beta-lactamase class C family)
VTALPEHTLNRLTAAAQRDGRAPSVVLAAGRDGKRLLFTGHGENPVPTAETQYRIGSITKTFTATLTMQLRDSGRLELDEPIGRYLPELANRTPTIRQLLTHTSGLQAEPDGPWWERNPGPTVEQLLAGVTNEKWALRAGRYRHYSNLGFGLLGAVIERVTGEPWRAVLRSRILDPAGLKDTGTNPRNPYATGYLVHPWEEEMRVEPIPDTQAMAPAGQLWSTAGDLLRWGAILATGHPDVLESDTAEEMCTLAAVVDPDQWTLGTGLGVQLNRVGERVYCGHSGSMPGYVACLAVHPESGFATVTFANCYTGVRVTTLAHNALTAILDTDIEPIEPWRPAESAPPELAPITGRWWWMGTEITIAYRDGGLVDVDGDQVARLVPVAPDVWQYVDGADRGEFLRVLRGPDGSVAALDIRTFVFTRDPWPQNPR